MTMGNLDLSAHVRPGLRTPLYVTGEGIKEASAHKERIEAGTKGVFYAIMQWKPKILFECTELRM